jgi:diguanylate cyclase (GGDEF)-like protein
MKKPRRRKLAAGHTRLYVLSSLLAVLVVEELFMLQAVLLLGESAVNPLGLLLPAAIGLLLGLAMARIKVLSLDLALRGVTDSLTGIHNRLWFTERLEAEIYRSKRYDGQLAVIVLDIDHFKQTNNVYGHQAADVVLVEVAALMQAMERDSDILARWGGEEFVRLLPNTSLEGAAAVAARMRIAIEKHDFSSAEVVTCSVGVTVLRPETDTQERFMGRADEALGQAKAQGRNRVVVLP